MHFLDLPAEIRNNIYHCLYNSIIVHPCTIPPSAHEAQYPPHSHLPCIPKYTDKISTLYITAFTYQDDQPFRNAHAPNYKSTTTTRIPTSSLTSPHRTCRRMHGETTNLLQHIKFHTLNLDIYNITEILSHRDLLPLPFQQHFTRLKTLDLNVGYCSRHLAVAMATAHRDGPMLLDTIWSPLNEFIDPALAESCRSRVLGRLDQGLAELEPARRETWAPVLQWVRIVFGKRAWEEKVGCWSGNDPVPYEWRDRLKWLRGLVGEFEVEVVYYCLEK